jgi:hypothetical protein
MKNTHKAFGQCTLPSQVIQANPTNPRRLTITNSDFADEYPGAAVIGTDISPIQPSWIPPNLEL